MLLVSNDGALAPEWLDHPLKGNWLAFESAMSSEISYWFTA